MSVTWDWCDCWVGFYWDSEKRILYVCPIPCLVFQFGDNR